MSRIVLSLLGTASAVVCAAVVALLVLLRRHPRRSRRLIVPEERADRAALRMLRETTSMLDADDAEPREVSFYLYFATRLAAEQAAAHVATVRVETKSLTVGIEPAARGATWLCLVTIQIVPTERAIRRASAELRSIASANGGEFDGWEVALPW